VGRLNASWAARIWQTQVEHLDDPVRPACRDRAAPVTAARMQDLLEHNHVGLKLAQLAVQQRDTTRVALVGLDIDGHDP
jgi:hypothetical protein